MIDAGCPAAYLTTAVKLAKTGTVLKLTVPETKYHDGKHLSTKYHGYWMCVDCVAKVARCFDAAVRELYKL